MARSPGRSSAGPNALLRCPLMSEPLVHNSFPRVNVRRPRRIAVGLQDERERDAVVSLLAVAGLAVNAGAIPMSRVAELIADPPDALVLVADSRRSDVLAAVRRIRNEA